MILDVVCHAEHCQFLREASRIIAQPLCHSEILRPGSGMPQNDKVSLGCGRLPALKTVDCPLAASGTPSGFAAVIALRLLRQLCGCRLRLLTRLIRLHLRRIVIADPELIEEQPVGYQYVALHSRLHTPSPRVAYSTTGAGRTAARIKVGVGASAMRCGGAVGSRAEAAIGACGKTTGCRGSARAARRPTIRWRRAQSRAAAGPSDSMPGPRSAMQG